MNDTQRKEFFSEKPMAERIAHDIRNCGQILRSDRDLEGRGEGANGGKRQPRPVAKALLVIGKEPGIKEDALRKCLKVRKDSLSWKKTAKRLVEHGLAVRENGCYTLTEKGVEHRKSIETRIHTNSANLFGALSEEEQKQLHGLMEKAVKAWHTAA